MSDARNPFAAGPGRRPPVLSGRDEVIASWIDQLERTGRGESVAPMALLAPTGLGKTALLHELARRADRAGWNPVVTAVGVGGHTLAETARGLAAAVVGRSTSHPDTPSAPELLRLIRAFGRHHGVDLAVGREPTDADLVRARDLVAVLDAVGQAARHEQHGYAVLIDNAHFGDQHGVSELLAASVEVSRRGGRLAVVIAGLPSLRESIATAASICHTQFPVWPLAPLRDGEVSNALVTPAAALGITVTPAAITSIMRLTSGYPYFVQLIAHHLVESGAQVVGHSEVEAVAFAAEQDLRERFYRPVLDHFDAGHRRFLRAMASFDAPPTYDEIAQRLGDTTRFDPELSALRSVYDHLISHGAIYVNAKGRLAFALPFFGRFLLGYDD
ncbi:MAG: AAA family ATPase [Acidimicrobiia bacterium]